jgi:hypothetical protein
MFKAGLQAGSYSITVSYAGDANSVAGEILDENWMELVSVGVPQGGTIVLDSRTEVRVRYVTVQEQTSLNVNLFGPDGRALQNSASGSLYLQRSGEDVFLVGVDSDAVSGSLPVEVGFIELRMYDGEPPFSDYLVTRVPYRFSVVARP